MSKGFPYTLAVTRGSTTLTIHYSLTEHPDLYIGGELEESAYYEFDYYIDVHPVPLGEDIKPVSDYLGSDDTIWKLCLADYKAQGEPYAKGN